jgi:hypothetical protein
MPKLKDRCAAVFSRRGKLFFQPHNRTITGLLIGGGPVEVLGEGASDQEIGQSLRKAVSNTRNGVPHPIDFNKLPLYLYEAAGVKSWTTFVKGTKNCQIADDGSIVSITPTRNAGAREGFQFLNDLTLELPSVVSSADLGRAIRLVLGMAE